MPSPAQSALSSLARPLLDALAWPHGADRYADLVRRGGGLGPVVATVTALEHQTADTVTLRLRADRRWPGFRAGQHVAVTVEIDGVRHTRPFSLAGSARAGRQELELTAKVHPTSKVARHLRAHARPGTLLGLSMPAGDFTLDAAEADRPLVLVSGGSGITPVMSMLRTLADDGDARPVRFVHYARTDEDVLYASEARVLAALLPDGGAVARTEDRHGRFSPADLDDVAPWWRDAELFVCGPPGFLAAVTDAVAEAGCLDRMHTELFGLAAPSTAVGGTVRFARSGLERTDDGRPLLVQAEAAGLAPEHGCRMGVCHTCVRRLESGCVTDARTGVRTSEPGATVRLCVSVPDGDVTVDL